MDHTQPVKWPNKYQNAGLWIVLLAVLVFGGVVEYRSAFLRRRMTDADVYFRTSWAVRTGADIYDVADTNGWHFQYPPFIAVLMTPLANPPPGADRTGMLPYGVSIETWYFFSVVCVCLGIHWLASALDPVLECSLGIAIPPRSLAWWSIRLIPFFACLPSIGRTLSRGQINLLVLMLFCACATLLARKRSALAGLCLGAAIAVKLIPGFLLLYGITRRDWRFLAGSMVGLAFCGFLVPSLVMGTSRTAAAYEKYYTVLLSPALVGGKDQSRTQELLNANGTDSQAFKAIINNILHASVPREDRPSNVEPWMLDAHWILVAFFTGITVWFGRRGGTGDFIYDLLFFGCLLVIMIPTSPVSHTHYFVYLVPLSMALAAHAWERHHAPRLGAGYIALFLFHIFLNVICLPVSLLVLKDTGFSLYGALVLWAAGIHALHRRLEKPHAPELNPSPVKA